MQYIVKEQKLESAYIKYIKYNFYQQNFIFIKKNFRNFLFPYFGFVLLNFEEMLHDFGMETEKTTEAMCDINYLMVHRKVNC